jgi:hypothetical protein
VSEYRPAKTVGWAVEPTGILVLDAAAGRSVFLGYPEAAAWDLIVRGNPPARVAAQLAHIASVAPAEAGRLTGELLARWCAEGLLEEGESGG